MPHSQTLDQSKNLSLSIGRFDYLRAQLVLKDRLHTVLDQVYLIEATLPLECPDLVEMVAQLEGMLLALLPSKSDMERLGILADSMEGAV